MRPSAGNPLAASTLSSLRNTGPRSWKCEQPISTSVLSGGQDVARFAFGRRATAAVRAKQSPPENGNPPPRRGMKRRVICTGNSELALEQATHQVAHRDPSHHRGNGVVADQLQGVVHRSADALFLQVLAALPQRVAHGLCSVAENPLIQAGPTPWRCPNRWGTSPGAWVLPGLLFESVLLQQLCQALCLLVAGALTAALSWPTHATPRPRSRLAPRSRAG